jgi:hypothetical protein
MQQRANQLTKMKYKSVKDLVSPGNRRLHVQICSNADARIGAWEESDFAACTEPFISDLIRQ